MLDGFAVQDILAVARRVEEAEDGEESGLAAARGAGNRNIFTLRNLHVNASERVRLHLVGEEHLLHVVQLNQCFAHAVCCFLSASRLQPAGYQ